MCLTLHTQNSAQDEKCTRQVEQKNQNKSKGFTRVFCSEICAQIELYLLLIASLYYCRFIAVSVPLNYHRKHVDQRQIVLLSATWILALAVASPVLFGINDVPNRDHSECKLENNNYVVYSSVCSFFVPCPIMLLLYCGIFQGLRRWEEARKAKLKSSTQACQKPEEPPASLPPLASLPPPLPPVIENDFADLNLKETDQNSAPDSPYTIECKNGPVVSLTFSNSGYNQDQNKEKKQAKINGRERKAMRVLPVVVGE